MLKLSKIDYIITNNKVIEKLKETRSLFKILKRRRAL